MICPCCGSPMTADATLDAFIARQGPVTQRLMRALVLAAPLQVRELAERTYADRDDGGPDDAEAIVRVLVSQVRPKLAEIDWRIRTVGWAGYVLERAA